MMYWGMWSVVVLPCLYGVAVFFLLRWRLSILSLQEDETKALGVNVRKLRLMVMATATLVTAACVSLCGQVGWVGLLIPHAVRMLYGSDNRKIIPVSIAIGYGSTNILHDLSFLLEENQILAVLGPNGVGKTTLLKCMMGLLRWDRGETMIDGMSTKTMNSGHIWKRIAYVPQSKGSSLSYTALEMVLMGRSSRLGLFAQPSKEDLFIAEKAMDEVGITFMRVKSAAV